MYADLHFQLATCRSLVLFYVGILHVSSHLVLSVAIPLALALSCLGMLQCSSCVWFEALRFLHSTKVTSVQSHLLIHSSYTRPESPAHSMTSVSRGLDIYFYRTVPYLRS